MKKITLDYILHTSETLLYNRISTVSGLIDWFVNDIIIKKDVYNFMWGDSTMPAKIINDRKNLATRIMWLDEDKEYIEFRIEKSNITKDLTLYITDFIETGESSDDIIQLWDTTIDVLKRKLGSK